MSFITMYLLIALIIFLSPIFSDYMYDGFGKIGSLSAFMILVIASAVWPLFMVILIPWKLLEKACDHAAYKRSNR